MQLIARRTGNRSRWLNVPDVLAVIVRVAGRDVMASVGFFNHVVDGDVVAPGSDARCWAYFDPISYISVDEIWSGDGFCCDVRQVAREDMGRRGNHRRYSEEDIQCQ